MDYYIVIGLSLIIILSHFFNVISDRTNIPSVVLLLGMGILMKAILDFFGYGDKLDFIYRFEVLPVIGTMGLILIVLEAALDLKLTRDRWPVIWRSFVIALLSLAFTTTAVALILQYFLFLDTFQAFLYAMPLSIMSSAIVIPSVTNLLPERKEFMIYESTFSDILGIMAFYFFLGNSDGGSAAEVTWGVTSSIILTIILSVVISGVLVWLFHKMTSHVKLFLVIAILMFLYAIGKLFHFSSLVLILVFGLMLNNPELFFRGRLAGYIRTENLKPLLRDFHIITLESAFVLRTFFFIIFGLTVSLTGLLSIKVLLVSVAVILVTYLLRYVMLKLFKNDSIDPLLYITPRGLITVLLFFSIPGEFLNEDFDAGILLFTIMATSLIMTSALIRRGRELSIPDPIPNEDAELEMYEKELDDSLKLDNPE
ncbi:MAG: sodium:proton exchanger [Flavobacteriales bacterium]|nr:sodium:proton exchanger [Flavobacteriales bacterium]